MSRALFQELKARQIAFLEARLVSEAAARDWRERLPAGFAALLATPLGELADAAAIARALDALAAEEPLRRAVRPAAAAALAALLEAGRAERRRARELMPEGGQDKLDHILEQPKLVPERLVREVLESQALDAVMRDVLYDALKEFSEKVNPFFAEWGLPALLKRVAPFGLGGVGKTMGALRGDFERRLEPEIRRFLQGFSRTAMRQVQDILIAKGDTPPFVALRKHVAAWVLDQEISALLGQLDAKSTALAEELGADVAAQVLRDRPLRRRLHEATAAFVAAHAREPLGDVLARFGVAPALDLDALAAATWPVVRSLCASAPVRAFIASMVEEFFDGLPDELAPPA
ncbi:hypothetical protein SOCE26_098910 [Sorangium cellulosum]|uniref:Uncharacterized protein n=1 Tax=Sorangium cellulosum TaxID=56 RepID=A0A2L0FA21_SORCE|nr:hypothetical protein [Sorangium cellulosum]AUX48357.1 hypothetical protein SOCE26_098910 [Sorangium cellulosum]